MSTGDTRPRYSREEVDEILRRAAERTHEAGDELEHEDLVAAAREAGIAVGALEHAATELATRREEKKWVDAWDARRKRRFSSHLVTWAVVNLGLFLLDIAGGPGFWFVWPLISWGIFVALHGVRALPAPTPEQVEKVARKERRRLESERKREERRRARESLRQKIRSASGGRGASDFERAVEAGVSALLEVAARRIDAATGRDKRPLPDSEFNRYVARQRSGPIVTPAPATSPAKAAALDGPRVRVKPDLEEDEVELERPVPPRRARR
jgi:hypothetical protein